MAPDATAIGAWLKRGRERHGEYSQEQAAAKVGTTARTMGSWERGETVPPADKFFALVLLYKADILELLATKVTKGGADAPAAGVGRSRRLG